MRGKGLKFTKQQLESLYVKDGLTMDDIAKRFGCNGTNVLYWLKKFGIKRRPIGGLVEIPAETLRELYWTKNMKPSEISAIYGISGRAIRRKMQKLGIPRKTVSEALTRKFKKDFSGNPDEKAFFLGLRAGDFHAKWARKSVRVQTSSTHPAQFTLMERSFGRYGEPKEYLNKNAERGQEWFMYVDLNASFEFLLEKPDDIPEDVLENHGAFMSFLAGYADCEGCWRIQRSHDKDARFVFRISTQDKKILESMRDRMKLMGYSVNFYIARKAGESSPYGAYKRDLYSLVIYRRKDIIAIIKKLLPLSKHEEKIQKMGLILKSEKKMWDDVKEEWAEIRNGIKSTRLPNSKQP